MHREELLENWELCAKKKNPEDDRTTRVGSAVPWRVVEVEALPDYILAVRFADGTRGRWISLS
jgi:hypothetical protein